jgi:hypothetical protein
MQMVSDEFLAMRSMDKSTQELRERNAARAAEMKERMGRKFVLHPDNAPRKMKNRRVLK